MMKKLVLIVLNMALTLSVFAQIAEKNPSNSANPDLSAAQKATLTLVKAYDLSGEQAQATLKIQQAKVQNLAGIEPMKTSSLAAYTQKRLAVMDIAANEFSTLLDPRQMKIFAQAETQRLNKITQLTQNSRKLGLTEAQVTEKLSTIE
jgi:hypothetical protein